MTLVTCDDCHDTSESGWGDTPLCLKCQRDTDPDLICGRHNRTCYDECPLCMDEHDEYADSMYRSYNQYDPDSGTDKTYWMDSTWPNEY